MTPPHKPQQNKTQKKTGKKKLSFSFLPWQAFNTFKKEADKNLEENVFTKYPEQRIARHEIYGPELFRAHHEEAATKLEDKIQDQRHRRDDERRKRRQQKRKRERSPTPPLPPPPPQSQPDQHSSWAAQSLPQHVLHEHPHQHQGLPPQQQPPPPPQYSAPHPSFKRPRFSRFSSDITKETLHQHEPPLEAHMNNTATGGYYTSVEEALSSPAKRDDTVEASEQHEDVSLASTTTITTATTTKQHPDVSYIAIIMGVNNYSTHPDGYINLTQSVNDALQMEKLFRDLGYQTYLVPESKINNEESIIQELQKQKCPLTPVNGQRTFVAIYFSGHGETHQSGTFQPVLVGRRAHFFVTRLLSHFADPATQTIAILDCCRTATLTDVKMPPSSSGPQDLSIIYGAQRGRQAYESRQAEDHNGEQQLSLFTKDFIESIRDLAKPYEPCPPLDVLVANLSLPCETFGSATYYLWDNRQLRL